LLYILLQENIKKQIKIKKGFWRLSEKKESFEDILVFPDLYKLNFYRYIYTLKTCKLLFLCNLLTRETPPKKEKGRSSF